MQLFSLQSLGIHHILESLFVLRPLGHRRQISVKIKINIKKVESTFRGSKEIICLEECKLYQKVALLLLLYCGGKHDWSSFESFVVFILTSKEEFMRDLLCPPPLVYRLLPVGKWRCEWCAEEGEIRDDCSDWEIKKSFDLLKVVLWDRDVKAMCSLRKCKQWNLIEH